MEMEPINIVLCGLGGQGILFMTRVLAQTALDKGFKVMGAETHGMAQRGGSVVSHLRLGEVKSSLVRTGSAHLLLALEENEGYRNLPYLSPGGGMYVNMDAQRIPSERIKAFLDKKDILFRAVSAGDIAQELDAPLSSNLALLGFFSALDETLVSGNELRRTIENISPDRFKETNLRVFDAGHEKGETERKA